MKAKTRATENNLTEQKTFCERERDNSRVMEKWIEVGNQKLTVLKETQLAQQQKYDASETDVSRSTSRARRSRRPSGLDAFPQGCSRPFAAASPARKSDDRGSEY